jgi:type I restriction enzyme M protein
MNLYLHGLEPHISLGDSIYDPPSSRRYDVILTNPPFGTRGANQAPDRDDFTIQTSNKQLNFIQHALTILRPGGRAAIVVPDNALFADRAAEVFEVLMEDCDLHTVLRCPRGTFSPYTEGTKTNVIFFTKGLPTEAVWIYDARANVPKVTKLQRPLTAKHFAEFEACYGADPNGRGRRQEDDSPGDRWRPFSADEVAERHFKLDAFKWIRDEAIEVEETADPEELLTDAIEQLRLALDELGEAQALVEAASGIGT